MTTKQRNYIASVVSDLLQFVVGNNPLSLDPTRDGVVCFYCKKLQKTTNLGAGKIEHETGCLFVRAQEVHHFIHEDCEAMK